MPDVIWTQGGEDVKWEKVWFDDTYTPPSKIEESDKEAMTKEKFESIINDPQKVEEIFTSVKNTNEFLNNVDNGNVVGSDILKSIEGNSKLLKTIISVHLNNATYNSRLLITDALSRIQPQEEKYYVDLLKSLTIIEWDNSSMYKELYNNIHDEKILKREVFKYMDTETPILAEFAMKNIHDPEFLDSFINGWKDGKRLGLVHAAINNSYNKSLFIEIHQNLEESNLDWDKKASLSFTLNERVIYLNKIREENVRAGM